MKAESIHEIYLVNVTRFVNVIFAKNFLMFCPQYSSYSSLHCLFVFNVFALFFKWLFFLNHLMVFLSGVLFTGHAFRCRFPFPFFTLYIVDGTCDSQLLLEQCFFLRWNIYFSLVNTPDITVELGLKLNHAFRKLKHFWPTFSLLIKSPMHLYLMFNIIHRRVWLLLAFLVNI